MPWYLYLSFRQLFPAKAGFVTFLFVLSVLGVGLGVTVLVVSQSVMGGFGAIYREKIVETNGHIRIESGRVLYGYERLLERVTSLPEVEVAEPYAQGVVMLQFQNRPAFPFIRGIDVGRDRHVVDVEPYIELGSLDALTDEGVLLSRNLASKIGASAGDTVEVYTPLMIEELEDDEVLLPRELEVVGLYSTGWSDFDSNTMVVTLRLMQELYGLRGGVHGIAVKVAPGVDEEVIADLIDADLTPPMKAMTWRESFADFLWVLELEKNMIFFLLVPIFMVGAFAIMATQLSTVLRKTREIGLLGALGGRPRDLLLGYCFQGMFIGVLGTVAGMAMAFTLLAFRDTIIHAFARMTGSEATLIKFYQFADLPVNYSPVNLLAIAATAMLLSTLAAVIPAIIAARMNPAEALRSE